jgi:hypothetical protein
MGIRFVLKSVAVKMIKRGAQIIIIFTEAKGLKRGSEVRRPLQSCFPMAPALSSLSTVPETARVKSAIKNCDWTFGGKKPKKTKKQKTKKRKIILKKGKNHSC